MTQPRYTPNEFSLTTKDEIVAWLEKHYIDNYTINSDLSVDVDENVSLVSLKLERLPLEFGHIEGSFRINNNELVSLNGCPHTVTGSFNCSHNQLTSLRGGPKVVGGGIFDCSNNRITSLEFSPLQSRGFSCSNNCLTSLKGFAQAGQNYPGRFYADRNQLTSLQGAPLKVKEGFFCGFNELTNLMHCPEEIIGNGIFNFQNNPITSLNYFPQICFSDVFVVCSNTGELVKEISNSVTVSFKDFKDKLDIYQIQTEKNNLESSLSQGFNGANINTTINGATHKI